MKVLLVTNEKSIQEAAASFLQKTYGSKAEVTTICLLQDAIEALENPTSRFDLIIFENRSKSLTLAKILLDLGGDASFIMCSADATHSESLKSDSIVLKHALLSDLPRTLEAAIQNVQSGGSLRGAKSLDAEYVPIKADALLALLPLKVDVHVRLGANRYVRLFRAGQEIGVADLSKYNQSATSPFLYLKKSSCADLLKQQTEKIDRLAAKPQLTTAEADKAASASYDVVKDVIEQFGFTPEAQTIAKSCVAMTIKAMGNRPKLAKILAEFEKNEGQYLTSHSLIVGKLACALAHRIGWHAPAIFLKLSLAAFLHDITLKENRLAAMTSFEDARRSGHYGKEELQLLRLHPSRAAEFAQQFKEIPSDVDTIVAQHHELPNGKGFPRGLTARLISPLSALFIIAHDLMRFSLDNPDGTLELFIYKNESKYDAGPFKKILRALKTDTLLNMS